MLPMRTIFCHALKILTALIFLINYIWVYEYIPVVVTKTCFSWYKSVNNSC